MESTDKELIEASLTGEVSAFQTLYERYWRLAIGVANGVCSDRHLAEDAAQEAFATAAAQLDSLRDHNRFAPWLRSICRRTAIRMRRQIGNELELEIDPADETQFDSPRVESLRKAIPMLDDDTRELLFLRYFSEMSHEDIARTLDITAASVHGRLQRGRRKLATIVSQLQQRT